MARRVALTGATGFLGSHITDRLLAAGHQVRAAVRTGSDLRHLGGLPVEIRPTDLRDPSQTRAFLAGMDTIVHCAGLIRSRTRNGYLDANVETTRCLVEAARAGGGIDTFLLVSSLAASGPNPDTRPLQARRETDPCRPITDYGRSKLAAEALLQSEFPGRRIILRPPALYGPRDRAFLPLFKAARRGLSIRVGNIRGLSLVDGRDCAAAAVSLLDAATAEGVFFVDDGHAYTFEDMAASLGLAFGRKVVPVPLPMWLMGGAAWLVGRSRASRLPLLAPDRLRDSAAAGWVCDGSKLRSTITLPACRDLAIGYRETLVSYREAGWID